jgi:hypothetical protein
LWLRMAHRGVSMAYHETVLGEHTLREEGLSGDPMLSARRKSPCTTNCSRNWNSPANKSRCYGRRLHAARRYWSWIKVRIISYHAGIPRLQSQSGKQISSIVDLTSARP